MLLKAKAMNVLREWLFSRGLLLVLVASIVPLTWFRGEHLIAGGDYFPELNPGSSLGQALYVLSMEGLGGLPKASPAILYYLVMFLLDKIGVSVLARQYVSFYLVFLGAGLSMYFLVYLIAARNDKLTPILAALLYMTNFWALISLWTVPYTFSFYYAFSYSFFPLMIALFIKGLKVRTGYNYIIYSSMGSLLTGPSYINPTIPFLQLLFLASLSVYYIIFPYNATRRLVFLKFLLFIVCWLLINAFWLLPLTLLAHEFLQSPYRLYSPDVEAFRSHSIPLLDALRITGRDGYWTLYTRVFDDPIIPWSDFYAYKSTIFLSFLLPIIAFFPLLLKPKDKNILFFSLCALISILFITGSNPPFGSILENVLIQTQLIALFRDPFNKFGYFLGLAYSYLWASCLSTIVRTCSSVKNIPNVKFAQNKTKSEKSKLMRAVLFILLTVLLLGVYVWPFWTGDVIRSNGMTIPSARIKVPSYYYEAARWLNSMKGDFNVLSLPIIKAGALSSYSWFNGTEGYFGPEPAANIFSKPLLYRESDANGIVKYVNQLLIEKNNSVGIILTLLNVRYILFHNDFHPRLSEAYSISPNPRLVLSALNSLNVLELDKVFGDLYFYRNKMWTPCQLIVTSNVMAMVGNSSNILRFLISRWSLDNSFILLTSNSLDPSWFSRLSLLPQTIPIISPHKEVPSTTNTASFSGTTIKNSVRYNYTIINPTKYLIHLNSTGPVFLSLTTTYNDNWEAYINGTRIPNEYHFVGFGFTNVWFIQGSGKMAVTLEFRPQRLLYVGLLLSFISFFLLLVTAIKYNHSRNSFANPNNNKHFVKELNWEALNEE